MLRLKETDQEVGKAALYKSAVWNKKQAPVKEVLTGVMQKMGRHVFSVLTWRQHLNTEQLRDVLLEGEWKATCASTNHASGVGNICRASYPPWTGRAESHVATGGYGIDNAYGGMMVDYTAAAGVGNGMEIQVVKPQASASAGRRPGDRCGQRQGGLVGDGAGGEWQGGHGVHPEAVEGGGASEEAKVWPNDEHRLLEGERANTVAMVHALEIQMGGSRRRVASISKTAN